MNDEMEFDLGPLTWVKGEMDHALDAATQALADWNGTDAAPLRAATAHLHQVSGALTIVDLQGVSLLCTETERLLSDMAEHEGRRQADSVQVALRAIEALRGYLDELMNGAPNAELRLADIHREVLERRGAEPPAPGELFFPDLTPRVTRSQAAGQSPDEAELGRAIRRARLQYQKGLLQFLPDKEAELGLLNMDRAVRELERLAPGNAQYTFWWVVVGFMESLRRGGVPADAWTKRLCGRIDGQMRRLLEGSRHLADRLLRDVLYYLALDKTGSGRVLDARRIFHLERYLPQEKAAAHDQALLRPYLNALREALGSTKDHWMKFCSGHPESLEPFRTNALALFEAASHLPNPGLQALLRMVQAVARRLPSLADTARNDTLQLEMATALLLIQNAGEHFEALGSEFGRQAEVQTLRLQAAIEPGYDSSRIPTDVPMLDEVSRQAQEKLILAQVTREIAVNLHEVEDILDKFFRNPDERARLPRVPGLMKQVLGALDILQLDTAAKLARESLERIDLFARPDYPIGAEELDWVADALSTLGLYVETLRYGRDDPQQLASLLARKETLPSAEASVESHIREVIERLRSQAAQGPAGEDGQRALRDDLVRLVRDADLVGNSVLRGQVDDALRLVDGHAGDEAIRAAIRQLGADDLAAVPAPSPGAAQLAEAPAEAIDAEMLAIYIEEANDVLGDIAARLARLHVSLYDLDALSAIRRGFHTLKGSGRMVGLGELAEAAWQVEQTLNHWLREERPPTPALLDFLEQALDAFTGWILGLEASGQVRVAADELLLRAQALRGEGQEGSPPPKPEAGAPADAPAAGEEEQISIGGHSLHAALFRIFVEEAEQRLEELRGHLTHIARGHAAASWQGFIRAAHTLTGIARTTGFPPLAETAHAVEDWAGLWPEKIEPLPEATVSTLRGLLDDLARMLRQMEDGRWPEAPEDVSARLAGAQTESEAAGSAAPEMAPEPPEPPEPPGAASAELPGSANERIPLRDELDPQLLPIFLEEAAELLPQISAHLRSWRAEPAAPGPRQALQRALHTLKGSARMAGAMRLGEGTHTLETHVLEVGEGAPEPDCLDALEAECDALAERIESFKDGPAAPAPPASGAIADAQLRQTLRLKADVLDTLLDGAGEVAIARARIETVLKGYKQTAQELAANVERLRSQLRELEIQAESQMRSRLQQVDENHFDPLEFDRYTRLQELTRMLAESVNDVSTAQDNLLAGAEEADRALRLQARMTRTLQHELIHIRMVPFDTLAERLHRVVRQAAKELERKAQLEIAGGETELDRSLLDRLAAPLEHLLRNAVAHGVETAEQRLAAGKPEYGELHILARREGHEVLLTVGDDGAGVDLAAVRARAEALGWLRPGEAIGGERLEGFLFTPGFTTARQVTELAGRGIGLDVVKNDIAAIGGRVRLETESGLGTRVVIRLPLTLAVAPQVLASAGGQVFALPADLVAQLREVRPEELRAWQADGQMDHQGEAYPLRSLAELTNRPLAPTDPQQRTILLLRSGDDRLALLVDGLEGNYEAVIKSAGPQLARSPGLMGATVLGDGRIALILNPFALAERVPVWPAPMQRGAAAEEQAPLVLVVDDSLTVRKITGRLLAREGYRLATAKDGVEALEFLRNERPAVMLLDIEMPRMDGFELTRAVRADDRLKDLPIVVITSRSAEKHRQHAMELGVNAYLGKPYQEEELLAEIVRLIGASGAEQA